MYSATSTVPRPKSKEEKYNRTALAPGSEYIVQVQSFVVPKLLVPLPSVSNPELFSVVCGAQVTVAKREIDKSKRKSTKKDKKRKEKKADIVLEGMNVQEAFHP